LNAEKTPWQSQAVPTINWPLFFAQLKNSLTSLAFSAPMPGAIEWLTRMNASGLANFINLAMVQGFFVFDVGHISGIGHSSMHSLSLLKLTISFPFPANKITDWGSFVVILSIASVHGASANLIFAMSAAT